MPAEQSNERVKVPVLVRFAERWQAESVLELCDMDGLDETILEALRAALDSPPVEERVEYRVVGKCGKRLVELTMVENSREGENVADLYRNGGVFSKVRTQSRTITTFSDGSELIGPWVDLEEGER